MGEPAHSLDMNEECCTDITTYCQREACAFLLQGKCMETIYLLDRKYHPTYNGTLLQVSWHPVGHPLPDHEEHRRCLLSPQCETILCQVQDPAVPHCDPEILPHICPSTTTSTTPVLRYSTTRPSVTTAAPIQSAESAQVRRPPNNPPQPSGGPPAVVFPPILSQAPAAPVSGIFVQPIGSAFPGSAPVGHGSPENVPAARQPVRRVGPLPVPGNIPPARVNPRFNRLPVQNKLPSGNVSIFWNDPNSGTLNSIVNTGPNGEPERNPENSPHAMPEGRQHTPQEPNESQQGNQSGDRQSNSHLPNDPRDGFHKPSYPRNHRPPQHQLPSAGKTTSANVYTSTTETVLSNINIWKKHQPKSDSTQDKSGGEKAKKHRPSNTGNGSATQKPNSSRAQSEFGDGRQGGTIQGHEPFFTLHRTGNISESPAPTGISTEAGPIGNAPNEWEKLDEKILAGGIVGGALLALLMVCLTVCCVKRRKDGKSSGASTTSSHRGLHLQYSGFPLDSDMLNDPVYKSSVKSVNGPPPVPYRPPAAQISYAPSFREPTNSNFVGGGGICFGEEQSESNDYEELPCDVEPSAREAYEELVEGQKQPTSRTPSNVSSISRTQHHKLRSVPTLYDINRQRMPPVVKRNSSASTLNSMSFLRNSMRPLPARPTDSLPRTLEAGPREAYEPLGSMETPHGYEVPITPGNGANLAMLEMLNYPHLTSTYDVGTLFSQGNGQPVVTGSDRSSTRDSIPIPQPDYFVLERQDELARVPTISNGDYRAGSRRQSLTYTPDSEHSYAEVGHEYLDLERNDGGWQTNYLPSDIHL